MNEGNQLSGCSRDPKDSFLSLLHETPGDVIQYHQLVNDIQLYIYPRQEWRWHRNCEPCLKAVEACMGLKLNHKKTELLFLKKQLALCFHLHPKWNSFFTKEGGLSLLSPHDLTNC